MIVLLGILLLAGLIFYVVNVGEQINRRLGMQNAADSAAISGATWMARSMNLIAMNNVAQTRMLSMVPILDAFPMATAMSLDETTQWANGLQTQLAAVITDPNLKLGLQSLHARLDSERAILAGMNNFFNDGGYDVSQLTFWTIQGQPGPPPHGQLWRAAVSLDEFSQAAAATAGVLSQADAVRYGRQNGAYTAFIVPVLPELPYKRTNFLDFQNVVSNGVIPDRSCPYPSLSNPYRLGPYDRLFQWRNYTSANQPGASGRDMPPTTTGHGAIRGLTPHGIPPGRSTGSSAVGVPDTGYTVFPKILTGYTTYGPFRWMLRHIRAYTGDPPYRSGVLDDTYFYSHLRDIANIKLQYMFAPQPLQSVHYPLWITSYPNAKALSAQNQAQVKSTMYYVLEIRSRVPKGDPAYLTPGTFFTNGAKPMIVRMDGWQDAADWKLPMIGNYIWEYQYTYETTEDVDIGIAIKLDATGQKIWQPVYMDAQYVFGGIDIGQDMEVRNPANWTNMSDPTLPSPIVLDTTRGDYRMGLGHDEGVRRDIFTYLGICQRDNAAAVWPQRFGRPSPYGAVVGASQAEIFNTTSWDLWTQDWKVKLTPVSNMSDWVKNRMVKGSQDAAATEGQVRSEDVDKVREYLDKFDPAMVNEMLQH